MGEPYSILLLFGVGALAGVINVMAGGGSTLTLPALILLGMDAGVANGTNRVGIVIQDLAAVLSFSMDRRGRFKASIKYALWAIPGALLGALVAVRITDEWFENILGILLIVVALTMLRPIKARDGSDGERASKWMGPALFGIGLYGGFIQMGIGFVFMAAFYYLARVDLVTTTVYKVTVILIYSLPALAVFAFSGHVAWLPGLALGAGTATGAVVAARLAIRRGEQAIRAVLVVAVLIMALRIMGIL